MFRLQVGRSLSSILSQRTDWLDGTSCYGVRDLKLSSSTTGAALALFCPMNGLSNGLTILEAFQNCGHPSIRPLSETAVAATVHLMRVWG